MIFRVRLSPDALSGTVPHIALIERLNSTGFFLRNTDSLASNKNRTVVAPVESHILLYQNICSKVSIIFLMLSQQQIWIGFTVIQGHHLFQMKMDFSSE